MGSLSGTLVPEAVTQLFVVLFPFWKDKPEVPSLVSRKTMERITPPEMPEWTLQGPSSCLQLVHESVIALSADVVLSWAVIYNSMSFQMFYEYSPGQRHNVFHIFFCPLKTQRSSLESLEASDDFLFESFIFLIFFNVHTFSSLASVIPSGFNCSRFPPVVF